MKVTLSGVEEGQIIKIILDGIGIEREQIKNDKEQKLPFRLYQKIVVNGPFVHFPIPQK
jgi:hypothetical protein